MVFWLRIIPGSALDRTIQRRAGDDAKPKNHPSSKFPLASYSPRLVLVTTLCRCSPRGGTKILSPHEDKQTPPRPQSWSTMGVKSVLGRKFSPSRRNPSGSGPFRRPSSPLSEQVPLSSEELQQLLSPSPTVGVRESGPSAPTSSGYDCARSPSFGRRRSGRGDGSRFLNCRSESATSPSATSASATIETSFWRSGRRSPGRSG